MGVKSIKERLEGLNKPHHEKSSYFLEAILEMQYEIHSELVRIGDLIERSSKAPSPKSRA